VQPDHPTAYYKAASLLKNLGKHEEAVAAFRQHLRLHPHDTDTLFWWVMHRHTVCPVSLTLFFLLSKHTDVPLPPMAMEGG
jgi:tetratricopeptide (TPR) repeat protein